MVLALSMSNPVNDILKSRSNLKNQTRLAFGLIPLLNYLEDLNFETEKFLKKNNIRLAELTDPAYTITLDQELSILNKAFSYIESPTASLDLARYYHLHNFSVLGLAIRACEKLADVFLLFQTYPRLQWGICETTGGLQGDTLVFELHAGKTQLEKFLLERDMACVKVLLSQALGQTLELTSVSFAYEKPDDMVVNEFKSFFECPVNFSAEVSSFSCKLSELDKPIPTADQLSKSFYEAQCARLSSQMEEPFLYANLVRDRLAQQNPIPPLEELCDLIDIEPRTLQRLLKKEGSSFSEILKQVRLVRACDLLRYSSKTHEQIAEELGFNDAAAFSHAFKQWTSYSPRLWLKEL